MLKNVLSVVFVCAACACSLVSAAELSKEDAKKLLTFTGDKNVVIAGVVNGIGGINSIGGIGLSSFSSPNVALVFAYAERNGNPIERIQTFFYDKDLGWFTYEIDKDGHRARVWTTSGYKEFRPEAMPNK